MPLGITAIFCVFANQPVRWVSYNFCFKKKLNLYNFTKLFFRLLYTHYIPIIGRWKNIFCKWWWIHYFFLFAWKLNLNSGYWWVFNDGPVLFYIKTKMSFVVKIGNYFCGKIWSFEIFVQVKRAKIWKTLFTQVTKICNLSYGTRP